MTVAWIEWGADDTRWGWPDEARAPEPLPEDWRALPRASSVPPAACEPEHRVPIDTACEIVDCLIRQKYGSALALGHALEERHGYAPGAGARIVERIKARASKAVEFDTYDRFWVLL